MNRKTEKSFVFHPSIESLRHFKDASAEAKLEWLEDAARFVNDFVLEEKLKKWKKISGK